MNYRRRNHSKFHYWMGRMLVLGTDIEYPAFNVKKMGCMLSWMAYWAETQIKLPKDIDRKRLLLEPSCFSKWLKSLQLFFELLNLVAQDYCWILVDWLINDEDESGFLLLLLLIITLTNWEFHFSAIFLSLISLLKRNWSRNDKWIIIIMMESNGTWKSC